jgi:hypothetical protein
MNAAVESALPMEATGRAVIPSRPSPEARPDAVPSPALPRRPRLAKPLEIEHVYVPDREAMAAALRVVLELPRVLPGLRGRELR